MTPEALLTNAVKLAQISGGFVALAAMIVSAFALQLNAREASKRTTIARFDAVLNAVRVFNADPEMQAAFHDIEHDVLRFDDAKFPDCEIEKRTVRLLRHLAMLALAVERGVLTVDDIAPMAYYFIRVQRNSAIHKYFEYFLAWMETNGWRSHPFMAFRRVADDLTQRHIETPHELDPAAGK